EFRDVQGTHNGGEVVIQGRSTTGADGAKGLTLYVTGRNIAADADLRKSFVKLPGLAKAWDTFAPSGRMNLHAVIDKPAAPPLAALAAPAEAAAGEPAEPASFPAPPGSTAGEGAWQGVSVTVTGGGCTLTPVFFPFAFDDVHVRGRLHYHKGRLDFSDITARHQATTISIDQ